MADEQQPKPVVGTILPPERRDIESAPALPGGVPLFMRAKYWAARRQIKSFTKLVAAQGEAYRALDARERARMNFALTLVQAEHLDDLRLIEELKIAEELASLVDAGEVRDFQRRAAKARAEAEAIRAERDLEELIHPKSDEAPPPPPERSPAEQAGIDITKMRKDAAVLKKTLVDCYGGEDNLTEEDRDLLGTLEVALRNKIVERLEDL
jgi:hypothetical protein